MKFLEEVEKLQQEYKGYVVLVKCGIFFTAIGKDAVILHDKIGVHMICMKEKLCKGGVPLSGIKKCIQFMQEEKMSFVICEYDKNKIGQRINVVHVESNKIIEEERTCLNCETCVNVQRILLRIMYKNKWIDAKKFNVAMDKIYEIGKIIGGLLKYYGKNYKKSV